MLRILSLLPAQQRELRHLHSGDDPQLARRTQFVLWSARGRSVPALAHALGCCRRTVRRWSHAFLDAGLTGLLGRLVEWGSRRGPTADFASAQVITNYLSNALKYSKADQPVAVMVEEGEDSQAHVAVRDAGVHILVHLAAACPVCRCLQLSVRCMQACDSCTTPAERSAVRSGVGSSGAPSACVDGK